MSNLLYTIQNDILPYLSATLLLPILFLTAIFYFFAYYWYAVLPREGTLEWIRQASCGPRRLTFAGKRHPMARRDALPLLLLTVVYAATAFWNLGAFAAPQSFAQLSAGETATFSLKEDAQLGRLVFYSGLNTGAYTLEVSADGETWRSLWAKTDDGGKVSFYYWADGTGYAPSRALTQQYSELFKWRELTPDHPITAKFLRLTGRPETGKDWVELGELALYDQDGNPLAIAYADPAAAALFDEQDTVPAQSTWYNSAYFDEIYHPRTAYEHIRGIYPYEVTHPPLGKLIMSLGIQAFGMTPFGWRFMGALFGVGMLPLLYVFLKNLFGKTTVAACGTALFAFDFMHLTQTRIATIDTYGVFFILCMYFFLYRYLTLPPGSSFAKGALPLFLSGLSFGLGAASKWTVIYGGAGLAILYFVGLYQKHRDWPREEGSPAFGPWLAKTLLFSVLCFVVVPGVIYTLAYLPYAQAKGDASLQGVINAMLENQKYMFNYHKGVSEPHSYQSRWYAWLADARPILYYLDHTSGAARGLKAAFGAFSNPVVCWGGLLAVVTAGVQVFRRRCGKALFLVVGYLAQLVPWIFIGRTTFAYHYFPSILFLVLCLSYVFNDLMDRRAKGWNWAVYGFTGSAVGLYAAFYPVLVGIMVPTWYTTWLLKWLPSWPF